MDYEKLWEMNSEEIEELINELERKAMERTGEDSTTWHIRRNGFTKKEAIEYDALMDHYYMAQEIEFEEGE